MRLDVRVSAIRMVDDRLLVNETHDERLGIWHVCVGGRLEPGERASECLRRELFEELGLTARVGRLVYFHEHAYDEDGPVHELGLYFLIETPGGQSLPRDLRPREARLCPRWLRIADLRESLYPPFLREQLAHDVLHGFPEGVQHFVSDAWGREARSGSAVPVALPVRERGRRW